MKKRLTVLVLVGTMALFAGCKRTPKMYGNTIDWSQYDTADGRVVFACGDDGCYSDGSMASNRQYDIWLNDYKAMHE